MLLQYQDCMLMFSDTSLGKSSIIAGCGLILLRPNRVFVAAKYWHTKAHVAIESAVKALLKEIQWTARMLLDIVIIVSDNLSLVQR